MSINSTVKPFGTVGRLANSVVDKYVFPAKSMSVMGRAKAIDTMLPSLEAVNKLKSPKIYCLLFVFFCNE